MATTHDNSQGTSSADAGTRALSAALLVRRGQTNQPLLRGSIAPAFTYGDRGKFPHRYPDDHPQSKSNPQIANCYPIEALGEYRRWLQEDYIEGGKFAGYLANKRQEIPPSVAQLAIERLAPKHIEAPE